MPDIENLEVIDEDWFMDEGETIVSVTSLVKENQVGRQRLDHLKDYHPIPGKKFSTKKLMNGFVLKIDVKDWPSATTALITKLFFMNDPKGNPNKLVAIPLEGEAAKLDPNWTVLRAAMIKGIDENSELLDDISHGERKVIEDYLKRHPNPGTVKSLILHLKADNHAETLYTCWKWP